MSAGERKTILLVEDSDAIREAFTLLLEESGYGVIGTASGDEAVRLAGERAPDLVLLDLGLPGKGGVQVALEIRGSPETARIPIVAVTGRDDDAQRRACREAGCAAFLVKPLDTRALIRSLPLYLARPAADDPDDPVPSPS
ncbi:MAG TPA: response regulator [Longimicrobiaceae bacterium]|nr:response regulator [Longimicrobiaceae bacterium]